jgi:hypothetical protein
MFDIRRPVDAPTLEGAEVRGNSSGTELAVAAS